jgi:phage-related protein
MGVELMIVQLGGEPTDFKPMTSIGAGAYEIRVRDAAGTFRTVYVTKFAEAIYVLHVFQKKAQKTAKADLELARRRYKLIPGVQP